MNKIIREKSNDFREGNSIEVVRPGSGKPSRKVTPHLPEMIMTEETGMGLGEKRQQANQKSKASTTHTCVEHSTCLKGKNKVGVSICCKKYTMSE